MSDIVKFQEEHPTLESYWRSIILFGRNVASYKFALAKSLLEIAPTGKSEITLEELAHPFSKHLCEHLKLSSKQATSNSSQFLDGCNSYNEGKITYDQLIALTVQKGFVNVIDAFHNVNSGDIPVKFYQKDYSKKGKKIILTDEIFKMQEKDYFQDLKNEAESRWNLVESAWELNISKNLLTVEYDELGKIFFTQTDKFKRRDITSARDSLNGYQKGKCFYCFDDITVNGTDEVICDIDHFYPHMLQPLLPKVNLDGVWNLVLACPKCNRGANGKFANVPAIKYLERLHKRNEFLISSHHPLRETLMKQTGSTKEERISFLNRMDRESISYLIHRWDTELVGEEVF